VAVAFGTCARRPQVAPPSRLSATSTGMPLPRLCVQVMASTDPASNASAVFGRVTVSAAAPLVNAPAAWPVFPALSWARTRTSPWLVAGDGTVQVHVRAPAGRPEQPGSGVNEAPPSRESETSKPVNSTSSEADQRTE